MKHKDNDLIKEQRQIIDVINTEVGQVEIESHKDNDNVVLNINLDTINGTRHVISSILISSTGKIDSTLYHIGDTKPICVFNSSSNLITCEEDSLRSTLLEEKYLFDH